MNESRSTIIAAIIGGMFSIAAVVVGVVLTRDSSDHSPSSAGDISAAFEPTVTITTADPTFTIAAITATPSETPPPTNTLSPSNTPTPRPTDTPRPTNTPRPTDTPEPTPTPKPQPGDVLYSATGEEFDSWLFGEGWQYGADMLLSNRDASSGWEPVARAPISMESAAYAVEAEIQILSPDEFYDTDNAAVGVIARAESDELSGYFAGIFAYYSGPTVGILDGTYNAGQMSTRVEFRDSRALNDDWHVFRLEVQGNQIRFYLDGKLVIDVKDNAYLDPGNVGIFSRNTEVSIRRFEVIAL